MAGLRGAAGGAILGGCVIAAWFLATSMVDDPTRLFWAQRGEHAVTLGGNDNPESSKALADALGPKGSAIYRIVRVMAHAKKDLESAIKMVTDKIPAGRRRDICLEVIADTVLPVSDIPDYDDLATPFAARDPQDMLTTVSIVARIARLLDSGDARVQYLTRAARASAILHAKASKESADGSLSSEALLIEATRVADGLNFGLHHGFPSDLLTYASAGSMAVVIGVFSILGFGVGSFFKSIAEEVGTGLARSAAKRFTRATGTDQTAISVSTADVK